MRGEDALALANELDEAWHDQPRSFEREAVTRFWGLLTLPARILSAARPRDMLRRATVLRNARFTGDPVKTMFFANKDFTEVDAIFLQVGSSLGHDRGEDAWVVEVERKAAHQQGDYFIAVQRAKKFAELLTSRFGVRARPVVIYDDDGGRFSYAQFEDDMVLIPMRTLRDRTRGLAFPSLADLPGVPCDKTLMKLALLQQLVAGDPNHPGWYAGPQALARDVDSEGTPIHLPVTGHQDLGRIPDTLAKWLARERESDAHLAERIERYLGELHEARVLDRRAPAPRLTLEGGRVVMRLLRAAREEMA